MFERLCNCNRALVADAVTVKAIVWRRFPKSPGDIQERQRETRKQPGGWRFPAHLHELCKRIVVLESLSNHSRARIFDRRYGKAVRRKEAKMRRCVDEDTARASGKKESTRK